ncbi:MAG: hypothetical protein E7645_06510 [Ruminococcaceae bacterium]|nr:hypothetical protein [Oscillospiraceae bacterium]
MKAMSGLDIFEKMTNVNDKFIEEAAEMPNQELEVVRISRWERFSNFMNSGWGVAMICCLVAAAVMTGIVAAGRAGRPGVISPGHNESTSGSGVENPRETNDKPDGRFTFDYRGISEQESVSKRDINFRFYASVTNVGETFTFENGPEHFYPDKVLFIHQGTDYVIEAVISEDVEPVATVPTGTKGELTFVVYIPQEAEPGLYALRLAYGDESDTFYDVLTILNSEPETDPPAKSKEKALEIAENHMRQQDIPIDLDQFRVSAVGVDMDSGYYHVSYVLPLGGIATSYRFTMKVTYSGQIRDYEGSTWDPRAYYATYTDEDVLATVAKMNGVKAEECYFKYENGKLYVCAEVIKSIIPPRVETDEAGNEFISSGCGIDHEHVFYEEEVIHTEN